MNILDIMNNDPLMIYIATKLLDMYNPLNKSEMRIKIKKEFNENYGIGTVLYFDDIADRKSLFIASFGFSKDGSLDIIHLLEFLELNYDNWFLRLCNCGHSDDFKNKYSSDYQLPDSIYKILKKSIDDSVKDFGIEESYRGKIDLYNFRNYNSELDLIGLAIVRVNRHIEYRCVIDYDKEDVKIFPSVCFRHYPYDYKLE